MQITAVVIYIILVMRVEKFIYSNLNNQRGKI